MIELVRTNDLVLISLVEAILSGAGVRYFVADAHMSALEGSTGFLPRRILVDAAQADRARRLLREAGLAEELAPETDRG
jgi:hypothetical protein